MTMSILKTVASYSTIKDTVNIEYECHSRLGSYVLQVSRSDFPGLRLIRSGLRISECFNPSIKLYFNPNTQNTAC